MACTYLMLDRSAGLTPVRSLMGLTDTSSLTDATVSDDSQATGTVIIHPKKSNRCAAVYIDTEMNDSKVSRVM